MNNKKKFTFKGNTADIEWDSRLCIHQAECGSSEGELFIAGREPWCKPDVSSLDNLIDITERCYSGALSYTINDGSKQEQAPADNTLLVSSNGPYYLRGDLAIDAASDDMPGVQFRAALCRCGQSKNKPFCDTSHDNIHFKDYGAVGNSGTRLSTQGGKLEVKSIQNGPLLVKGNLTITAGSGRVAWQGENTALCRCGESKNKPFCDGAHSKVGFKTD